LGAFSLNPASPGSQYCGSGGIAPWLAVLAAGLSVRQTAGAIAEQVDVQVLTESEIQAMAAEAVERFEREFAEFNAGVAPARPRRIDGRSGFLILIQSLEGPDR
jgi:hypothetical protein